MSTNYVTVTALKATMQIVGTASDADLTLACDAASRLVEEYKRLTTGRSVRYYSSSETRYYTPEHCHDLMLNVDDFQSISTIAIDRTWDYSYSETWTASVDYVTEPANNLLESKPQRTIVRVPRAYRPFPEHPQSVKITGTFGWATAPTLVQEATSILAARLYGRRNAPFGILAVGVDSGAAIRLPKTDPDVATLLDAVDSDVPRVFA